MNTWQMYVQHVAGDVTGQTIATNTGISQSTASRWLRGVKPPTEAAKVAAFAKGYRRNVLEAFVAAGMITIEEAVAGLPEHSIDLLRRLLAGETLKRRTDVALFLRLDGDLATVQLPDGRIIQLPAIGVDEINEPIAAKRGRVEQGDQD